ncbi:MAG: hypothetical protein PT977_13280 [Acidobacteriota bacterium]|nr:hypothetical protein [Acidobacteriota bacterium]
MSATTLTNAVVVLERVPVRERGASFTAAAWSIAVRADEGAGTIVRLEAADGAVHFRGAGRFLGWSREEMEAAWGAMARSDAPSEPELPQLG